MTAHLMAGFLPFEHEPYHDFSQPAVAQAQRDAFARVRQQYVGRTFPLYIGGERREGGDAYEVRNPADTREVVWCFPRASAQQRDEAIAAAQHAFETWRFSDPFQRSTLR